MAIEFVVIAGLFAALSASAAPCAAQAISRVDGRLTAADGSGFAIIVERDGAVILRRGYGLANRTTGERFTTETIAQLGSISEPR